MTKPNLTQLKHVALYAPDPDKLAEFYETILGLHIVAQSKLNIDGIRESIYLNNESKDTQYQLSIFANTDLQHTAFGVSSLANLRAIYGQIVEQGLRIRWMLNHGISLALYFHDPADNLIKLFWSTGIDYPQPYSHPIDFADTEEILLQDIENLVKKRRNKKA